jgi:hypothetical protein
MTGDLAARSTTSWGTTVLRKLGREMSPGELDAFTADLEDARLRFDRAVTIIAPTAALLAKLNKAIKLARALLDTLDDPDVGFEIRREFPVVELGEAPLAWATSDRLQHLIAKQEGPPTWRGLVAGLDHLVSTTPARIGRLESRRKISGERSDPDDHPMKHLVGTDLVRMARDHLNINDGFSRNEREAHGAIIDFVAIVLDTISLPHLAPETIARYITQGRTRAR